VGTALIGSVAGVAALCATAVFGSSLAHLTATPALYGAPYQYFFNSSGPGAVGQALGMVRRQLATIVFWQATTVAVIAIAAGIPLGIAAGRAIWRAFATSLGVVPVPAVQAWLIVALAAGALVAANALAAVPAMSAARSRPGQLLRTE
jgi:predicted lysophospholipase L1 biosynthesis ABC-type transport system permease subunit